MANRAEVPAADRTTHTSSTGPSAVACPASINPVDFVSRVQPLLERKDLQGLLQLLKSRWTYEQIKDLIASHHHDARKVAMLALALVGGPCCIPALLERLKDRDACANQMAEHALWSVWFRCGSQQANQLLKEGSARLENKEFAEAEALFTAAIEVDPDFAEAYNQRAIVRYLTERYQESIEDCRKTVELMPCHFGAWAGLGHCHAHLGQIIEAIQAYKKTLEINPHQDCVAQTVAELRRR